MKTQMKKLILSSVALVVLCSIYFALRPRTIWWAGQDEVFGYKLISDGPWLGEGFSVYLEVKERKTGKVFFYRRILGGLDTNGIPGFKSAIIDSKQRRVVISVEINGYHEVTIPVLGWEGYWSDYK